jgi:hypothetical protein
MVTGGWKSREISVLRSRGQTMRPLPIHFLSLGDISAYDSLGGEGSQIVADLVAHLAKHSHAIFLG